MTQVIFGGGCGEYFHKGISKCGGGEELLNVCTYEQQMLSVMDKLNGGPRKFL